MKSFLRGALAAGVAATALFNVSPANAAFVGCGNPDGSAMGSLQELFDLGGVCALGDKTYTITAADTDLDPATTQIMLSVFNGNQHTIIAQSGAGLIGTKFNYNVAINSGPETFVAWQTDATSSLFGKDYDVTTAVTNSNAPTSILVNESTIGGGGSTFIAGTTSSDFTNTINNIGSPVQQLTNTVIQTPGPLPILGAGAAFGFSRKLRSRIKASA